MFQKNLHWHKCQYCNNSQKCSLYNCIMFDKFQGQTNPKPMVQCNRCGEYTT